jgi:hypothetical protein
MDERDKAIPYENRLVRAYASEMGMGREKNKERKVR